MAAISFSRKPEEQWVAAGWVFRQVLDDTISQRKEDVEMRKLLEESKALKSLMLYLLEPDVAKRTTTAIAEVVSGILSGVIKSGIHHQSYGNANTVQEYRKGLQLLLNAIPH
jgi:hypothetical protein